MEKKPKTVRRNRRKDAEVLALQAISLYASVAHRLRMEARDWDCEWPKSIAASIDENVKMLRDNLHSI